MVSPGNNYRFRGFAVSAKRQRGAVLFVALALLLVLTLLGVSGVRVATLQERMAGGWLATNQAFQQAEAEMRGRELALDVSALAAADAETCEPLNFENWVVETRTDDNARGSFVRRIDQCSPGGSLGMGTRPESEQPDLQFQITAFASDDDANPSAEAVLDSVFLPHPTRPTNP